MKFFTLIHICSKEQSMHNNSFGAGFEKQISVYLNCAKQLHRSLQPTGIELVILTNDKDFLVRLNVDQYPITIVQLTFSSSFPSGIKFYSAHFKLEVFHYLSTLKEDYIGLIDADMICINKIPSALQNCITQKLPLYYDITDQVMPAYGAANIIRDKEIISQKKSVGLWAGGEFIAGPPSFFKRLSAEIDNCKQAYFTHIQGLHHQGDEVLTSVAIEAIKTAGDMPLMEAGSLSIVGRYWSYVPLHAQKSLSAYANHFLLHLPSDKSFLSGLSEEYFNATAFIKKYNRQLLLSRSVEKLVKHIKPFAKRMRKKMGA